ncbi:hypothetical protein GBAR_LOCUS24942 [Geodia barretti]|uniref:Uncharacterized protein n=1 Tax=Geodia barretti TaxID=519541 RepID=A0AA35TB36_GEOBA|nr:hypothetical protein GBAR_LOCUS24942 [Geodia barretti]
MASTSSRSDLMDEYHRLAADTLLGAESNKVAVAILQAAEGGELERLVKLLTEHRDLVDARHPDSGDTPLISAARSGHKDPFTGTWAQVVDVLLSCGADVTLENNSGDSVLDVEGDRLRRHILKSISHEDRSMSNAKALLRSAWLGDSVRLSFYLSIIIILHQKYRMTYLYHGEWQWRLGTDSGQQPQNEENDKRG